ncbi:MAG: modification methylase [Lachnospiraceae bacterium]|nr:modification methylase [Lachnospiraceae bacterium]
MAKNTNLHKAKDAKNDEFYTQISDIEKELKHYKGHFKGAVVFCNCDDPEWSNFWKYFHLNFEFLGLKKLITTHYETEKPSYKMEYEGGNDADCSVGTITPLMQNGDFRSPECVELLKEADIVVTNPPFSLFREYVAQLMEYGKKFVVIGSMNAITYKEIFPLLKNNHMWLGCNSVKEFVQPDGSIKKFGNILWFTNLDIAKRHEELDLIEKYSPEKYPKYDNYDAINVDKVTDIPCDYDGVMGVPITFLDKYNPEQFVIVGMSATADTMDIPVQLGEAFMAEYRKQGGTGHFSANMYGVCYFDNNGKAKVPYGRILVRKKAGA